MGVRIQFVASEEEYEELKRLVKGKNVSISQYVKDRVLPKEDSFEKLWKEFLDKLEAFPKNVEFNISAILTDERWRSLDKSSKLSIARLFNKQVTSGEYSNIQFVGRSSSNVSIYKKIE